MKGKRWFVLGLIIVVLVAIAFVWLSADPGSVLIRLRGWRVETSVAGAVAIVIAAWVVIGILWWLLRWPFGALSRRHRRISHERLRDGLVALTEGRNVEAARTLQRAAQYAAMRSPALLAAADARHRHGDTSRALEALDEAAQYAPDAARILRARILREAGRAGEALQLLTPGAEADKLRPAGWHEYALAALVAGQPDKACAALEPLRKSAMLGSAEYAALTGDVLAGALASAADATALDEVWKQIGRKQRQTSALVAAYARRAADLGVAGNGLDEIEAAVKRAWNPELVVLYGEITPSVEAAARLRNAQRWLGDHSGDEAALRTLGVLSARAGDPKQACDYLLRALGGQPTAAGWAALGGVYSSMDKADAASRCLANAWRCEQGEEIRPGAADTAADAVPETTSPFIAEERDQHGLPRLSDQPSRSTG